MSGRLRAAAPAFLTLVGLVAAWQFLVPFLDQPRYVVPTPGDVLAALGDTRAVLPGHLWATASTAVLGLLIGAAAGVALAAAMAGVPLLRRAIYPLVVVSQSVPMVVLAPVLVIWFGFGLLPRLLVVALVAFFPVTVATVDGLLGADDELVDLLRSMGAGRAERLRRVLVPSALPGFFAGLKVSAAYAMFGAVVAEFMGASEGLAVYLERSRSSYRTDQVFVAVLLIALVSVAIFGVVQLAARLAMPWRHAGAGRGEAS